VILKLLKYLLLIFIFVESIVLFMPKERLFNALLFELDSNKINLKSYSFSDDLFSIDLNNINILYDNIDIANTSNIKAISYIFHNEINVNDIKIDNSLNSILPSKVDNVNIVYSILNPLFIDIRIYSSLYKATGYIDVLKKKLIMNINLSKQFKSKYPKIMRQLKYDKNTKEYIYEYSL